MTGHGSMQRARELRRQMPLVQRPSTRVAAQPTLGANGTTIPFMLSVAAMAAKSKQNGADWR